MKLKLILIAILAIIIAFVTLTIYIMGLSGFVLLLALSGIFAYLRYLGNTLAKLIIQSHEKLHKNDEAIYKRVKSLEGSKK